MLHSSDVTESMLHSISTVNGTATLLILLLFIHFVYNVYIQKRTTSATITINISNECHFKTVSILQTLIFILSLLSCIIGTFFISNLIVPTLSSNACSVVYLIFYCSWFIAQYLVIFMFIFRLYNIAKLLSSKWKNLLISLAVLSTFLNITIIIIYAYISSHSLMQTQSSNNTLSLCTDDTQWRHYLAYVTLQSANTLLIICIFMIYVHQFYFIKTHNISSIYSYSYLSLSTTTKERHNVIRIEDNEEKADSTTSGSSSSSSDVISSAVAATLQNAEVTIGTNRRKRNYTSNTTKHNKAFIGKVKTIEKKVNVDENTNITLDIKQTNTNNVKHEQYVGDLRFVVEKEFIFETVFVFVIIFCFVMQVMDNSGVMRLYLNGVNVFVNCLCSVMLFHYNNDLWYDILRYIQCYCFYDCCWKYCNCFIWDKQKNCGTFCCKSWAIHKVQESDDDIKGKNNELNENENKNKKSDQQKSIYVRGSLRRLHQK